MIDELTKQVQINETEYIYYIGGSDIYGEMIVALKECDISNEAMLDLERKIRQAEAGPRIKKWRQRNPDKCRNYTRNYNILKRANGIGLNTEQWKNILEKYNFRCAYCGVKNNLTRDHVIPINKGGEHSLVDGFLIFMEKYRWQDVIKCQYSTR